MIIHRKLSDISERQRCELLAVRFKPVTTVLFTFLTIFNEGNSSVPEVHKVPSAFYSQRRKILEQNQPRKCRNGLNDWRCTDFLDILSLSCFRSRKLHIFLVTVERSRSRRTKCIIREHIIESL